MKQIILFLFCRPTDHIFFAILPVDQKINLVSPYSIMLIETVTQSKISCINVHCDKESYSRQFHILWMYVFSYTVPFLIKVSTKNPPY